jgi:hypothetical protein
MTRIRLLGRSGLACGFALLAVGLISASCSATPGLGKQQVVFSVSTGFSQGINATTADVVDIGVPPFGLYNLSSDNVRITAVKLVSPSGAVRVHSLTAYVGRIGNLAIGRGDFLKLCRATDPPHAVTAAVTQPHSSSAWQIVLAVTFVRPGRYRLYRAKIFYTAGRRNGWQYTNLNATIVVAAARTGTRPKFDGCLYSQARQ